MTPPSYRSIRLILIEGKILEQMIKRMACRHLEKEAKISQPLHGVGTNNTPPSSFPLLRCLRGQMGRMLHLQLSGVQQNVLSCYSWGNMEKWGLGKDKRRQVISPLNDDTRQGSVFMLPDQTRKLHTAGRESQKVR